MFWSAQLVFLAAQLLAILLLYRSVLAILHGGNAAVSPTLGIAALPSLHVAAQALFFVWCWRLRSRWRTVFLITTGLTFMGSVATGWHWAVDGFAGLAIAVIAGLAGWALTSRWERAGSDPPPRLMAEPTPVGTALVKRPEANVMDREERHPRGQ